MKELKRLEAEEEKEEEAAGEEASADPPHPSSPAKAGRR